MEIKLNCQSSIRIKSNITVYFDPYLIKDESHDADYIFITHDHYDHFDLDSINNIRNDNTVIILPDSMKDKLEESNKIIGVEPNNHYDINGISFDTIPSYNTNKTFHQKAFGWVGYLLKLENKIIYVAGDTDITEENKQVKCDIAFVPIGGTYTMDYKEAAELINIIKPSLAIPTHYFTIVGTREDAESFKKLLNDDIECNIVME